MSPKVTFDEWRLVSLAPWGRVASLLALVAALAILGLAWRALRREPRPWRRRALLLLRLGAVATALTLFFEPAVQLENVTRLPNHVAVLVDASESMRLSERAGGPSRAARAAAWLTAHGPALARLRQQHQLDFYSFGAALVPTTEQALTMATPATAASADATHLGEALSALRGRYDGRDLGGVIVLSDGIDNGQLGRGGALDADAVGLLKSLDAPVHAVWVGQPGLTDVAVARVLADDFAFVRTAVQVEAVVRVVGQRVDWPPSEARALPVTLYRDGAPVRTVEVTLEPGQSEYHVQFRFTPDRVGKYLYEVATPVIAGEALAENNARAFVLNVIRDKIRVLQVTGRPSWDVRFLRGLCKHDPNVDLISFFILRTPTDLELVPPDELSLIPFPTDELFQNQLRSFDVVFLQNFNFGPYGIGAYLDEIKRYVEEGGALAMLGGDLSFSSGDYARTPIAEVLPVELSEPSPSGQLIDPARFRLQLTADGRVHPVTALRLDVDENRARWAALPELDGTNLVARARPGATVLGVHPTRKDADGKPLPVLTVGDAGKGRVLALTSDDSWRWGFGDPREAHDYQRFWESAIRWLIRDPSLSFLRVETDQSEYARGQKVQLTARALGPAYQPLARAPLSVTVTRTPGALGLPSTPAARAAAPWLAQNGSTDDNGELTLTLDPPAPGGYRVEARGTLGGRPLQESEVFLVRGAGRELGDPEARDDLLKAVAASTGGEFGGPATSLDGMRFWPPRAMRVNRHRNVELWSRWWMLALAALCLSANWALRRRWGYA